ncbi:MAG TPA: carboxymuconolactone decarboxylase family protein [Caulobacteraceae bacterium]|nr:carboxymuconolactone decarboxylase family protein [Caulobacteraceae bacterium]
MKARMKNPLFVFPDVLTALQTADKATEASGLPEVTKKLVHLRASQINGCSFCVDMHSRELREANQSPERIAAVAAWRDTSYFDDAERAALALTEAATRIADQSDAVPDEIWDAAAQCFDEKALAALVVSIALINAFNRVNVPVRQPVRMLRAA